MTLRRIATPVISALILTVAVAVPAHAAITVFGSSVYGDGDDDNINVACVGGVLDASGVTGSPCAGITDISVSPDAGTDNVNVAAVTAAAFPALVSTVLFLEDGEADVAVGSPLSDRFIGDELDTLSGGDGDDIMSSGVTVSGGPGDDTILEFLGSGGAFGGPGDDRFIQGAGPGGLDGGTGFDTVELDFDQTTASFGQPVAFVLTADELQVVAGALSQSVPLSGMEQAFFTLVRDDQQAFDGSTFPGMIHVRGMSGIDDIRGGALDDALYGGTGNDSVTGNGGVDVLSGGDGDDVMQARDGLADRVDCGAGNDTVVADASDVVLGCESVQLPPVPPAPAPPPVTPATPGTSAVKGPASVTQPDKAKFKFSSPTAGATFQCKLDTKSWKACTSPYTVKSKKLDLGKHKLQVRAKLAGVVDATPSKVRFKVKKG